MVENNLNDEVIKIFIESRLVKYECFKQVQDYIGRSFNRCDVVFRLNERNLELVSVEENKVLQEVPIVDMEAKESIAFAKQAYMVFHQAICEIKKNH
ncbi:hypothetical protein NQU59_04460 [Acinetobacter colistiniresistens]|uniref:hypothetical protein n=1 Tax=Acinetobacter colistiniresistens TaxID=280145 RepID=UPI00211C067A|nr:hypothetical protein [Acinetobacter colistiniresistens]UUM28382.1 hypothetical protein NQU59_04460 [Acinetobacter colistiniresistens]